MVFHQAFRARHLRKNGFDGEVQHGVPSSVSRETSLNNAFARSTNRLTYIASATIVIVVALSHGDKNDAGALAKNHRVI